MISACNWELNTAFIAPHFCQTSTFLNLSDFEPIIVLKLFLYTKCVIVPKNLEIFQSLLMFY